MICLGQQHPRLGLLYEADRQKRVAGGVDVLQLGHVVEELEHDLVAALVADQGRAVLRLHPAADPRAHRVDADVDIGGAAGVLVQRPERGPGAARLIHVDRQAQLDRADLVDLDGRAAGPFAVHPAAVIPVAVVQGDLRAVVGAGDAVVAQLAGPGHEVVVVGAGERSARVGHRGRVFGGH